MIDFLGKIAPSIGFGPLSFCALSLLTIGLASEANDVYAKESHGLASEEKRNSKVSFTRYLDTRNFNTLNLQLASNGLPAGSGFWGFTDFHGNQNGEDSRADLSSSFSEYRLFYAAQSEWPRTPGLGLQAEYNVFTPGREDLLGFGVTYKHSLPLLGNLDDKIAWLQWRVVPFEKDGDGGQASLLYFIPVYKGGEH